MCWCVGGPDDVIYVYMCMLLLRLNSIRQRKPYAVQIAIVCVRRWCFLRRFKKLERASRISFGKIRNLFLFGHQLLDEVFVVDLTVGVFSTFEDDFDFFNSQFFTKGGQNVSDFSAHDGTVTFLL